MTTRLMGNLREKLDTNPKRYIELAPSPYLRICPNCGGSGLVMIYELESDIPSRSPIGTRGSKWLDLGDGKVGWYKGKTLTDFCPVCQQGRRDEFLKRNSGLSAEELLIALSSYRDYPGKTEAKREVSRLLAEGRAAAGFLTLHGSYGVGKTYLLMAMVNGFRLQGILARYTTMPELMADISSRFGNRLSPAETAEAVLEDYKSYPVLVVDELDKKNLTGWALETLQRLVDVRHRMRSTHLTAFAMNTAPNMLPPELGYVASRMGEGAIIEVGGEDMRRTE